jgi:putative transposase
MTMSRSNYNYQSKKGEQAPLRMRIKDIAAVRVRYGYKRIHILLRREGWQINHKRVHRLYCLEGLNLRAKGKKKRMRSLKRPERLTATGINESWSMDFVSDALFNGRRFRALTIVDNFSRECPAILVGQGIHGDEVVELLERLKLLRGLPETICVDNGSEFVSKVLDKWAYEHGVKLSFSRPGKPVDNAFIESFNGSFRDECLSVNWFLSIEDAKQKIEAWRQDYNEFRPHSSLENMTPSRFAELNHPKVA